jgi:energy-coupling factor transport system permease protein
MLDARSIAEPSPGDTVIHRMDPRAKIILLLSAAFIMVALDNPKTMLLVFITVLAGYVPAKLPAIKLKTLAVLLLLVMWGTMYSQALFYSQVPKTVIFTIIRPDLPVLGWLTRGGLYVYKEGFHYGAVQGLRSATVLSLGLLMCWTTDPRDMLNGLVRLKVPYSVAFMVVTAVRFLPIIIAEVATVVTVQRLRGFKPTRFGSGMIRTALSILTPTLASCVRRAGVLAVSIESRAFRAHPTRTYLKELQYSNLDRAIILMVVSGAIAIVAAKILFYLYTSEIYYSSEFREIYALARGYL